MITTIYSNDESIDWGVSGNERIVQNVKNILRTRVFEVPLMREMGINEDFIDADSQSVKSEFVAHVTEVIKKYEDRVTVRNVSIESYDEDGNYVIAVELEV